jgi:hypothetical protein
MEATVYYQAIGALDANNPAIATQTGTFAGWMRSAEPVRRRRKLRGRGTRRFSVEVVTGDMGVHHLRFMHDEHSRRPCEEPVGEPDAGDPHVRFDERGWETERWPQAPSRRARPRLYSAKSCCEQVQQNSKISYESLLIRSSRRRPKADGQAGLVAREKIPLIADTTRLHEQ